MKPCAPSDQLINRYDLLRRWDISLATLRRMERRGALTVVRLGPRLIRYRLAEIEEYESAASTK